MSVLPSENCVLSCQIFTVLFILAAAHMLGYQQPRSTVFYDLMIIELDLNCILLFWIALNNQ